MSIGNNGNIASTTKPKSPFVYAIAKTLKGSVCKKVKDSLMYFKWAFYHFYTSLETQF